MYGNTHQPSRKSGYQPPLQIEWLLFMGNFQKCFSWAIFKNSLTSFKKYGMIHFLVFSFPFEQAEDI